MHIDNKGLTTTTDSERFSNLHFFGSPTQHHHLSEDNPCSEAVKLKSPCLKLFTKSVEIIRVFLYFLHHSVVCFTQHSTEACVTITPLPALPPGSHPDSSQ
jgi:hypothetical protein